MSHDREQHREDVPVESLRPVRGIRFEDVIRSLYSVSVERFDPDAEENRGVLNGIVSAMQEACRKVQKTPIERLRPNEVGNDMEPVVIEALQAVGLQAARPLTRKGGGKSAGYPDVIADLYGLDCDMKSEFNSDKRRLYAEKRALVSQRVSCHIPEGSMAVS